MNLKFRHFLILVIAVTCGLIGGWAARGREKTAVSRPSVSQVRGASPKGALPRQVPLLHRDEFRDGTAVEIFASSDPGQVILRFPTDEAYGEFLYALGGSRIDVVDRLDRLRAVRLGYDEWTDLTNLLEGENIVAYDSLPGVPAPSSVRGGNQAGVVGFDEDFLVWLGITSDNSQWGAGVKVAVLDTGIIAHPALPGFSESIAITPFPADLSTTNGHGTAVASLIAGIDPLARGIAPGVELVSIRVGDDSGKADSFALAAGILAAVDAGSHIINCSMGTTENNPLIEDAVLYARQRQVLIVAAAGNSERGEACYPAAYPSVISVGSVDARSEHLDFSNYGTFLSVTAPGYAIHAAWPGNRYSRISGTSASAPLVTGAIAATMSNGHGVSMTASQAADIVMHYADDAGIPGPDSQYGVGILNIGRIMGRDVPGTIDAAITQQRLVKSSGPGISDRIEVTVQNRGTASLISTSVELTTPFGSRQFNATMIAPGGIQTFSMPFRLTGISKDKPIQVSSSLVLGTPGQDSTPQNNHRSESLYRR